MPKLNHALAIEFGVSLNHRVGADLLFNCVPALLHQLNVDWLDSIEKGGYALFLWRASIAKVPAAYQPAPQQGTIFLHARAALEEHIPIRPMPLRFSKPDNRRVIRQTIRNHQEGIQ